MFNPSSLVLSLLFNINIIYKTSSQLLHQSAVAAPYLGCGVTLSVVSHSCHTSQTFKITYNIYGIYTPQFIDRIWASLVAQMVKESACNVGDQDSIPGLGRSP